MSTSAYNTAESELMWRVRAHVSLVLSYGRHRGDSGATQGRFRVRGDSGATQGRLRGELGATRGQRRGDSGGNSGATRGQLKGDSRAPSRGWGP